MLSSCLSHMGDTDPSALCHTVLCSSLCSFQVVLGFSAQLTTPDLVKVYCVAAKQHWFLQNRTMQTTYKPLFRLLHLLFPEERVSLNSCSGVLVTVIPLPKGSGHGDKLRLLLLHQSCNMGWLVLGTELLCVERHEAVKTWDAFAISILT